MSRSQRLPVVLVAVALAATPFPTSRASAQSTSPEQRPASATPAPNFGGTWELSAAESDFGSESAPTTMQLDVVHDGRTLTVASRVASASGERASRSTYDTGGAETRNVNAGVTSVSTTSCDGVTCVMKTKSRRMGMAVRVTDSWMLSADGRTLTIRREVSALLGSRAMTMVFHRS